MPNLKRPEEVPFQTGDPAYPIPRRSGVQIPSPAAGRKQSDVVGSVHPIRVAVTAVERLFDAAVKTRMDSLNYRQEGLEQCSNPISDLVSHVQKL